MRRKSKKILHTLYLFLFHDYIVFDAKNFFKENNLLNP